MPFAKGQSGNPKGRPAGPNKVTTEFRDTVRKLLDDNAENVGRWLTMVAEGDGIKDPDPARALTLMAQLAEYAAPKLARTEVVGDPLTPLTLLVQEISGKSIGPVSDDD